jgi:hypothetical protein
MVEPSCRRQGIFWPVLSLFFLQILKARSTLPRRLLTDTRPPAAFSVAFRPNRRKIQSCRSLVTSMWCPRASGLSSVWCACGPQAAFFWPISAVFGRSVSDLRLGGAGVSACPLRAAVRLFGPFSSTAGSLFLGGLCFNVVCSFSLFLVHSLLVLGSIFMRIFVG